MSPWGLQGGRLRRFSPLFADPGFDGSRRGGFPWGQIDVIFFTLRRGAEPVRQLIQAGNDGVRLEAAKEGFIGAEAEASLVAGKKDGAESYSVCSPNVMEHVIAHMKGLRRGDLPMGQFLLG